MGWGDFNPIKKVKASVAAKVFGQANPILAAAGVGYDYLHRNDGSGGGPGAPPSWSGEGAPTARQQAALDRYALYSDLGKTGKAAVWANKAERRGISGDLGMLADKYGNSEDALTRMATAGGPVGARHAARLESQLGEQYMTDAADMGRTQAQESIGYGAANLERDLRALGAQVDPSSPAYQALAARYLSSRQDATVGANRQIDMQLAAAKAAARAGALSPQALIDIGDTVFALDQLHKEEQMFSDAQRGAILGNPTSALYRGFGGSSAGAIPFSNSAWASFQRVMSGMSAFGGMGGGGGAGTTLGVSPVQGMPQTTPWTGGGTFTSPNGQLSG